MKFILLLVCLTIFGAYTQASNCWGRPLKQSCGDVKDKGHSKLARCKGNSNNKMWYYDQSKHSCGILRYEGCGGNNNRFCSKTDCDAKCVN